jgi:hypothetical protein
MRFGGRRLADAASDQSVAPRNAVQMRRINDALTLTMRQTVSGDVTPPVPDTDHAGCDGHRHTLADQPPGHRIEVGIDRDGAIIADDAG